MPDLSTLASTPAFPPFLPFSPSSSITTHHLPTQIFNKINPSLYQPYHTLHGARQPPSAFTYNSLIRTYIQDHLPHHALFLFNHMLSQCVCLPDKFTFPLVLKACSQMSALQEGMQIHSMVLKINNLSTDVYVQSCLVDVYVKCGRIDVALQVLDGMPERTVVAGNSIVDGYVKSGDMDSAYRSFIEMPERDIVSWNCLIGGCVQNSLLNEALALFLELQLSGLQPDEQTMSIMLSAVSDIGLLAAGKMVHGYIMRRGLSLNGAVGVALTNMYTKCGSIGAASNVFRSIPAKNVGHWTSMIGGLAAHGLAEASLLLFSEMLCSSTKPNDITFVSVLSACSHAGLLNESLVCFDLMAHFGIRPSIEHYGCLVDVLGRSGFLQEALEIIDKLPMKPNMVIWSTLLASCRNHGNVEIAEIAAKNLIQIQPSYGGGYLLLSNLYARIGKRKDSAKLRMMMEESRAEKVHGFSSIEVNGSVHEFVVGDKYHVQTREIYEMLDEMKCNLLSAGYQPEACDLTYCRESIEEEDY
ncbi:pentatricopeptide repeat-containing protein At5g66520-like [Dioscorea cayenensis subsp. rotundata]|uniref:Pentatricopeptide repeat-containing protein At5g66520-like n=1 Tax=Dioscorea cayennensis subsp. rotundata TaxID=55577 RepID=A0AB40CZN9_DIOCR|nr:pentatricopeptide repeat-containing protein At5g66520-like [Dioscorea cayenensis subsp. rotundata]XP_039144315.1 pentatricopeptide repeat-containing protein At5g66520-like [Dioscorea cayenensis subsp. rotundata]XP_039144316.1 pentatricopeptide repeat-containing protein At5g66520-like [Dioscorea cayenensis subsp. rotundata]